SFRQVPGVPAVVQDQRSPFESKTISPRSWAMVSVCGALRVFWLLSSTWYFAPASERPRSPATNSASACWLVTCAPVPDLEEICAPTTSKLEASRAIAPAAVALMQVAESDWALIAVEGPLAPTSRPVWNAWFRASTYMAAWGRIPALLSVTTKPLPAV